MASNYSQKNLTNLMFEDVRHQIGLAVRGIQWSYAILWSETQPGILKWGNGMYNGEIKTKSKTQVTEQNSEDIFTLRSDQLRELFESLAESESNPQAKKLHSALSPEDLSEHEWFYLVCMSFIFHAGQELPGKVLEKGQHVWLSNAHLADSKVFGRSLLANSASIKTVACFPVPGGVVELGVTDKVAEDAALVRRITDYLQDSKSIISCKESNTKSHEPSSSNDNVYLEVNILDADLASMVSPLTSSSELGFAEFDDSFIADSFNQEITHLQSWQFIDEDLHDYVHLDPDKVTTVSEKLDHQGTLQRQESNQKNYAPQGSLNDEMHYQSVISAVLQTSAIGSQYGNTKKVSSFASYTKGGYPGILKSDNIRSQRMLKKVLMEVPKMNYNGLLETLAKDGKNVEGRECEENLSIREAEDLIDMDSPEVEETGLNHVLAERRRREKLKRRFLVLRSLVPTTTKVDKVSILDDTIKYLRELERRIGELESTRGGTINTKSTSIRKHQDQENTVTISENSEQEKSTNPKPSKKKRKSC